MSSGTNALDALLSALEGEIDRVTTFELKQTLSVLRRAVLRAQKDCSDQDYSDYMSEGM